MVYQGWYGEWRGWRRGDLAVEDGQGGVLGGEREGQLDGCYGCFCSMMRGMERSKVAGAWDMTGL